MEELVPLRYDDCLVLEVFCIFGTCFGIFVVCFYLKLLVVIENGSVW